MLIALFSLAHAACEVEATNSELVTTIDDAMHLYEQLEIDAFLVKAEEANGMLPCLDAPIARHTAAEFHRMAGLQRFVERDSPAARKSFAAARSIEPDFVFSDRMAPAGNPVLDDYTALPTEADMALLAAPEGGTVKLDGKSTLERPADRPVIFQLFNDSGALEVSIYVNAEESCPAYPTKTQPQAPVETASDSRRPRRPFLLAGAGGLALAGGLFAGATVSKSTYQSDSTTLENADSRRSTTNTLVIASGVAGAAGLGLTTTSFLLSGRF